MKKQLILLGISALVLGVTSSTSPAFAGYQSGFNLIISPIVFSAPQPVVYSHYYGSPYIYNQYPVRPIKTVGIVNVQPSREVVYVKHVEPVRINKYRGGYRNNRHW